MLTFAHTPHFKFLEITLPGAGGTIPRLVHGTLLGIQVRSVNVLPLYGHSSIHHQRMRIAVALGQLIRVTTLI